MVKEAFKSLIFFSLAGLLSFMAPHGALAQPTYYMSDNYVEDCEGILLDSEEGPEPGQYDHDEDYTFTVCVTGATEIIINFDFFATEANYDILTVYDGPDKNSPVLATLSGVIQPPPVLIARSGCVTFHFVSDDNIVAKGWVARWMVEIDEPEPPLLSLDTMPDCPMTGTIFTFDRPIDCDNFDPSNFSLIGPSGGNISNIEVLDCDTATGKGQRFLVEFDPELNVAGNYRLIFEGAIQDVCGEWHDVAANTLFELTNCPIELDIELVADACEGDCGRIRAFITGSSSPVYLFDWSHTSDNGQEVEICADDSVIVNLVVTDPVSGEMTSSHYIYRPRENPVILNPLEKDTFCSSRGDHFYQVSLPGGEFFSREIQNNTLRNNGRYQFWRYYDRADLSEDIVRYVAPNGCETFDTLYTNSVWAGSIQASCLGAAPFRVNGGNPAGGVWSGPHISTDGIFDPNTEGSFVVTYTAPNGCRHNKRINVGQVIDLPDVDTICSSQRIDLDMVTPYGGRWSGPGIVNSVLGRIEAWRPTPNRSYDYVYNLNGCTDTLSIYIREIDAGSNRTVCDADSLMFLNYTGTWTGPGDYIDSLNAFDISGLGTGKYKYRLEQNGCADEFELEVIIPELRVNDDLFYCYYDQWFSLNERLELFPDYGAISGAGIKDSVDEWWINPVVAGPGMHPIAFDALGCSDTAWIEIEAPADIPEYEFCELSTALQLQATPAGGTWSGPGFLDTQTGLFDPQLLSVGEHYISYRAPSGCITQDTIEIFVYEEVEISGLDQQYCYTDTMIPVALTPSGGSFFINGQPASPQFNPAMYGEGNHEIYYTKGVGACESDQRRFITVLAPITGNVKTSNDSICLGSSSVVSVDPSGGAGIVSANWDSGLGFGTSHIVNPTTSRWYRVELSDGCSDNYYDSVRVYVYPEFDVDVNMGPDVCFEDTTWLEIITPDLDNYEVNWLINPPYSGFRYEGNPGLYTIEVSELFSGCVQEYDVLMPGEDPLKANFSMIPNGECIDIIDNEIQLIDLSLGYTDGTIDYGDGSSVESLLFGSLSHEYENIGEYTITLTVTNDLGCTDTLTRQVCVENKVRYFIPNIFTPNGDDKNDELSIQVVGGTNIRWSVYDRTGGLMFEALSADDSWDGTFNGKILNPNVFVVVLSFTDQATGRRETHYGSVTLIR